MKFSVNQSELQNALAVVVKDLPLALRFPFLLACTSKPKREESFSKPPI